MSNENELRLLQPEKVKLHGQERIFATVNRTLAPGGGMCNGNDVYYPALWRGDDHCDARAAKPV
jgi:hypothetical protein